MTLLTTFSSRELNQDVSSAKKAAKKGPVLVTDRGRPAYVLMTYQEYAKLATPSEPDGADFLSKISMEEDIDIEFERLNFEPREVIF